MVDSLDIADVARRTGLSSRALRYYETRGLVRPLRSANGRRLYGPAELERLHQIVALKRAGLSLRAIARVVARGPVDLAEVVAAQIDAATAQISRLQAMRTLLRGVRDRLDRDEAIDIATLCAMIREGEDAAACEADAWAAIHARYFDTQTRDELHARFDDWTADLDPEAYNAQWAALVGRIRAALPMDPADPAALALVRQWFTLLAPFSAVATPAMWEGTRAMYDDIDQWREAGRADPGFDGEVWRFINAATAIARTRGDDIGPVPAWMNNEGQQA